MKPFIKRFSIIGGGGFGHEVISYIRELYYDMNLEIRVWDKNPDINLIDIPELHFGGSLDNISVHPSEEVLICIGDCKIRSKISDFLNSRGINLGKFIHPAAVISSFSQIESGCIIFPFSCISTDACIGFNTVINSHVAVGHHATIGPNSVISPHCLVSGGAKLGSETFLGAASTITPGKSIGSSSKIAAGSVVYRNAGSGAFLSGNPARNFRKVKNG